MVLRQSTSLSPSELQRSLHQFLARPPLPFLPTMFFSKFFYSVFAVASIATMGFASPVAQPAGELVARQSSDAVSELQSFQSTVSPLLDQLTQAAATGADPTAVVNQLASAFSSSTDSFNKKKSGIIADVDVVVFVDVAVDVVAVSLLIRRSAQIQS
ncbi:hypothetical protein K474DRAFT_619358 [Panus rudis PR-1116 ss-1]|nr:hypothetical protein K474DRAFT_619358 [Panus rudis PR-1116 ss-1]